MGMRYIETRETKGSLLGSEREGHPPGKFSIESRVCDSILSARGVSQQSVWSQKLWRGTWEEGHQEAICKPEGTASVRTVGRGTGGADLEEMGGQRRPFRGDGEGGKTGRKEEEAQHGCQGDARSNTTARGGYHGAEESGCYQLWGP